MKAVLLVFVVVALVVASCAQAARTDPRVCMLGVALACGKENATMALRVSRGPGWDAQILCRAFVGLLRYRCTWRNAVGKGSALVTFTAPGWSVRVTQ